MRRLFVRSRWQAEDFVLDEPFVAISITDSKPHDKHVKFISSKSLLSVLFLEFMDYDVGREAMGICFWGGKSLEEWAMQPADADAIWKFVNRFSDTVHILVNCCWGRSRSLSIALALADSLGVPRESVDYVSSVVDRKPPNLHCYNLVKLAKPLDASDRIDEG